MKSPQQEPTVYVVDDEPEFVKAIRMLLGTAGLASVGFTSPQSFLRAICPGHAGCILLDVRMPSLSGLEVHDAMLRSGCRQPVVFLTGHGDIPMAVRATRSGAFDFLEKPVRDRVLLARIRAALAVDGKRRRESARKAGDLRRASELSPRERQVAQLLALGLSSAEMAKRMNLSVRTVEMHRLRMMRRLGVRNAAGAVRVIVEANEVPAPKG